MAPRKSAKASTPQTLLKGSYLEKNAPANDVIPSLKVRIGAEEAQELLLPQQSSKLTMAAI